MALGRTMIWLVQRALVVAVALGLVVSTAGATPMESACCLEKDAAAADSCCAAKTQDNQETDQGDGHGSHGCAAWCCHVIAAPGSEPAPVATEMPGVGVNEFVVQSNGVCGGDVILPPPRA